MTDDRDPEKAALGRSLAAARKAAGFTMESAARALTENGHEISKQAVGAWEVGRNLPDALWLKRLAKLYDCTTDALVGNGTMSLRAAQIAQRYDAIRDDADKERLRGIVEAFVKTPHPDDLFIRHEELGAHVKSVRNKK